MRQIVSWLGEMLTYPFMQRAFLAGILICVCASLLGVSLVLKRYSMIGDGLSHVGFGALAVASALHLAPLAVTIPVVILAAFVLLRLGENGKLKGDAAVAMFSTGALAVGVMVVSLTTGMNADLNSYLFGSILAMSRNDVVLSVALAVVVLILYLLFYNQLFAVTFDPVFARATGVRTGFFNVLLAVLTADPSIAAAVLTDNGDGTATMTVAAAAPGTTVAAVYRLSNAAVVDYITIRSGLADDGEVLTQTDGTSLVTTYEDRMVYYNYFRNL